MDLIIWEDYYGCSIATVDNFQLFVSYNVYDDCYDYNVSCNGEDIASGSANSEDEAQMLAETCCAETHEKIDFDSAMELGDSDIFDIPNEYYIPCNAKISNEDGIDLFEELYRVTIMFYIGNKWVIDTERVVSDKNDALNIINNYRLPLWAVKGNE